MPTIKGLRVPDKELVYEAAVGTASPDTVSAPTIWVDRIRFVNTTAGALTVTVLDGQGTPVTKWNETSIAADSVAHENFETPEKCVNGLTVQASGSGLVASIHGWQQEDLA